MGSGSNVGWLAVADRKEQRAQIEPGCIVLRAVCVRFCSGVQERPTLCASGCFRHRAPSGAPANCGQGITSEIL